MLRQRVRLKRTLNRRVEAADGSEARYYKWMIADVPKSAIEALGWDEADELTGEVRNGTFVIRRGS